MWIRAYCPKCQNEVLDIKYNAGRTSDFPEINEHFQIKCCGCRYTWTGDIDKFRFKNSYVEIYK